MELISRQAVYDMLHGLGGCDASDEWSNGWDKAIDTAIKELDKIPTAYDDDDKVVEELENRASLRDKMAFSATDVDERYNSYIKSADIYRQTTSIMKGGGQG